MKKQKQLHIGTMDSIKGFKNISLDLKTYEQIFHLSQNNNMGVDLSVAKTIKFLLNFYLKAELNNKQIELLKKENENVKIQKSKKAIQL